MTSAPATPRHARTPGYATHKADHLARLNKIEGQIRGISGMVTDGCYCIDVLTQISAACRALQEVALGLLDAHVRGCVTGAARTDPAQAEEKFTEFSDTLRRALPLQPRRGARLRHPVAGLPPQGMLTATAVSVQTRTEAMTTAAHRGGATHGAALLWTRAAVIALMAVLAVLGYHTVGTRAASVRPVFA